MTHPTSPTVSRRWLALEMRRLRKERRLSQGVVAKALGCQVPKISLLENGQRPLHDADLKTLLELFDVPDKARQRYLDELKNAQERGWWEHYDDHTVAPWFTEFVGLEQGATRLRTYQPALVHGLLQTQDYATEIFRGLTGDWSEGKIRRHVEVRRRRQAFLSRDDDAPDLSVVLDEAALRHVVGSREVMRAQLAHVVQLCSSRTNVTVQVVPFDRGGSYEATYGSFTLLSFPDDAVGVVYMEQHLGGVLNDKVVEVDKYSGLFEQLTELAISPEASLDMLTEVAADYAR